MRHVHGKIRMDVGGVAAEHNDTVGENDGLFDIVSDDDGRSRQRSPRDAPIVHQRLPSPSATFGGSPC